MRERWEKVWRTLGAQHVPGEFEELIASYSSPDRFYHNLGHIEDCLSVLDWAASLAVHPAEVELAIWFHDAIYDTHRSDNEQRSAEWAESAIRQAGLGQDVIDRVTHLILATRHTGEVIDSDAQLMIDVDLSILGREASMFWQYEENIRKEYAWVPETVFKQRRAEILRSFLDRPAIYFCEMFQERYEKKARLNLRRAIEKLSDHLV